MPEEGKIEACNHFILPIIFWNRHSGDSHIDIAVPEDADKAVDRADSVSWGVIHNPGGEVGVLLYPHYSE
jgi:hypothetical protein